MAEEGSVRFLVNSRLVGRIGELLVPPARSLVRRYEQDERSTDCVVTAALLDGAWSAQLSCSARTVVDRLIGQRREGGWDQVSAHLCAVAPAGCFWLLVLPPASKGSVIVCAPPLDGEIAV
jgi:hypothetical protein